MWCVWSVTVFSNIFRTGRCTWPGGCTASGNTCAAISPGRRSSARDCSPPVRLSLSAVFAPEPGAIEANFSELFTSQHGLASVSEEPDTKLAMDTLTSVLFTLLLKVGVASSFAALLARWNTFRRVLFTEERDPDQKLKLMLFMTPPLIVGVSLRLVGFPYRFADLSLEGAFLMGLLGGRVVGPIGGAIITIPALMGHEWLGMPAASTAGLLGGLIRQTIPNKEDLWNFGPFTFLNIPRDVLRLGGPPTE